MDKPVWEADFQYFGPQNVLVSCHAGDFGARALCNIIGDQPLFYIDDTADAEDQLFLMEDGLDEFSGFPSDEKFMAKMRAKLESYDKTAKSLSSFKTILPEEQFDKVIINTDKQKSSLQSVLKFGQESSLFKAYLKFITDNAIEILHDDTVQSSEYNRAHSKIGINPNLDTHTACLTLMKSMRMAWNHKKGLLINPLSFQPEESILINRLIHADLDVTAVSFLWDMKLAGHDDVWLNAMSGVDYDLCAAYAMEAMTDFRSIKSGLAARATFEKWFISGRCKEFDREIIQTMMGGHTDIDIDNSDASRVIAMDLIAGMGNRPEGKNYLSPIVTQIMNDALYGEVRDRSNANFLWFVTFERRMKQMEQELQEDNKPHKNKKENNVLSLPQNSEIITSDGDTNSIASVFFLDHFRAG